jgi:putative endonuclease
LHFFEVNTRTPAKFGHPEESIGNKKMQIIINTEQEYQYLHPKWKFLQFAVLSNNMIRGTVAEYFLIEDVFF